MFVDIEHRLKKKKDVEERTENAKILSCNIFFLFEFLTSTFEIANAVKLNEAF